MQLREVVLPEDAKNEFANGIPIDRVNGSANNDFGPLDLGVLNEGRRRPPDFPTAQFGEFWGRWIEDAAEVKGSPPDYVGVGLLVAAASLIGNARRVSPWLGWIEPSILWACCVGLPSSGKSPALDAIMELLDRLQDELGPDFEASLERYEADKEAAKVALETWKQDVKLAVEADALAPIRPDAAIEPDAPVRPRLHVSDTTPEQLGYLLKSLDKGILVKRDELAGWLGNMDRYGAGTGERSLWLEAFGGRQYAIDRVKHGNDPIVIRHFSASVLGNMVPDKVSAVMGGQSDDGLAARFMFIWPDPRPVKRPQATLDVGSALMALRQLRDLEMTTNDEGSQTPVALSLTADAAALFDAWREENALQERTAHGQYLSHLGKLPGILLRIALIIEFLHWSVSASATPPDEVGANAIGHAADFIEQYLIPMAQRVCGDAGLPAAERHAAAIARQIKADRLRTINAGDIRRHWKLHGLREATSVMAALSVLEESNWIRKEPSRAGKSHGRHRSDYSVNPAVLREA
jgi:Protein of unknown function (DUF3987)